MAANRDPDALRDEVVRMLDRELLGCVHPAVPDPDPDPPPASSLSCSCS